LFGQVSLKDPNVKGLVASVYYWKVTWGLMEWS
jgi:hypothetical protein